jgi:hypothetical protein
VRGHRCRLPRLGTAGGWALALGLLTAGLAPGPASAAACTSYPRPGTIAGGPTPAGLGAEYGVLRTPAGPADHLAARWLRPLPASGIVATGVRFLGRATYGRVYLVPARHLLSFPLAPAHCLPRAQRGAERALVTKLRGEYAHPALCLVIVYGRQESPTCAAAPGTVDPLLYAPGSPGFGMVPDGVASVRVHYVGARARRVRVHGNLWIVNDALSFRAPCGLEWLNSSAIVLRTVQTCNTTDTT